MTRLLNTPIIGSTTEIVPSSWIDMLAGLSRWVMRSTPPCFCAQAEPNGTATPARIAIATKRKHADKPNARLDKTRTMTAFLPWRSPATAGVVH